MGGGEKKGAGFDGYDRGTQKKTDQGIQEDKWDACLISETKRLRLEKRRFLT